MTVTAIQLARYKRVLALVKRLRGDDGLLSDAALDRITEEVAVSAVVLADELERARALLRDLEWRAPGGTCHVCRWSKMQGHNPTCALGLFLGN